MVTAPARVIVLTGVSRGLGRALATEFVRAGHTVLGCARSAAPLESLRRAHPAPNDFARVDVASDAEVRRWAERLLRDYPAPDLLINNAALINPSRPLWRITAEEFAAVIDTNLKGVANVLRHFLPAMVAAQRGVIVNLSSGWGRSTEAEVAPYCATKWGIEGLTRALAQELPGGMAAVPLNPGIIDTAMLRSCFGEAAGRYPGPDRWAKTAVPFLLQLGPEANGRPLTIA